MQQNIKIQLTMLMYTKEPRKGFIIDRLVLFNELYTQYVPKQKLKCVLTNFKHTKTVKSLPLLYLQGTLGT